MLDDANINTDSILAVVAEQGTTQIGPLDETGRSAMRDRLYTAGELLRLNQMMPDPKTVDQVLTQLRLFDNGDAE